jgi:hypothetical protein
VEVRQQKVSLASRGVTTVHSDWLMR